jgi:hypothetical protein
MNSKAMDQDLDLGMRTRRNAYRISALVATLIFLVVVYICMVPGMYPRDQFLLFVSAAVVLIAALTVGLWGIRKAPLAKWPLDPLIGIVLLFELGECAYGIFKVLPLAFR